VLKKCGNAPKKLDIFGSNYATLLGFTQVIACYLFIYATPVSIHRKSDFKSGYYEKSVGTRSRPIALLLRVKDRAIAPPRNFQKHVELLGSSYNHFSSPRKYQLVAFLLLLVPCKVLLLIKQQRYN